MALFWKAIVALLVCLWGGVEAVDENVVAPDKCPCLYERANEGECLSYSRSSSGNQLQGWEVASDNCLDRLGIQERILPNELFWSFCPYPNRTKVHYDEIISYLKDKPDEPIAKEIMALFVDRGLFAPSGTSYILPDQMITSRSVVIDCVNSPNLCWAQVRVEMEARKKKMNDLCRNLHDRQIEALKREQATARLKLCDSVEAACEPLASSIQDAKPFGNDCTNFGVIIAKQDLPKCDNENLNQSSGFTISVVFPSVLGLVSFFFM